MRHHAIFHHQLGHRHFPLRRARTQQTGTRRGGRHAQRHPCIRHAAGAPGGVDPQLARHFAHHPFAHTNRARLAALVRVKRVKRQTAQQHHHVAINLVWPSLLQCDAGERHVQLFGHQHRQRGVYALAHFAARHCQDHRAIRCDLDPAVQRHVTLRGQHVLGLAQARARGQHAPADHQYTRSAQATQNPGAALHALAPAVAVPLTVPAAR